MASVNCSSGNCGIYELYGLSSPVKDILTQAHAVAGKCAHIWFSDADVNGNGEKLRKEIVAYGLGTVAQSPSVRNPNTNNVVTGYVWTPNTSALRKYLGLL